MRLTTRRIPRHRPPSGSTRRLRSAPFLLALTVLLCLTGVLSAVQDRGETQGHRAAVPVSDSQEPGAAETGQVVAAPHHSAAPPAAPQEQHPDTGAHPQTCPTADTGCLSAAAGAPTADLPAPTTDPLPARLHARQVPACTPERCAPPRTPTPLELSISRT